MIQHILTFILAFYGNPSLPRKIVNDVIDDTGSFIREAYLPLLKKAVMTALKKNDVSDTALKDVEKCFDEYREIFENVSSEAKRFNLLREKGFIDYEEFPIGITFVEKIVGNNLTFVPEYLKAIHIPLRKSLKLFLEIPSMFQQILDYIEVLRKESYIISNMMQADLWLQKYSETIGYIVLPLFLFYDDLETGNPLGSHAGVYKFGAVYAFIACLPPHIASRLSSIFLTTLVRSNDKKISTNKKVFKKIIEEVNFLQSTGISIEVNGIERLVKFQLVMILGDNLGLNSIFGMVESFKAKHSCRICKVSSEESATSTVEDESELRTKENYEKDVRDADTSKTGVKESCAFNEIKNFHITQNLSLDMMHDLLEGVCEYVMRSIISKLIFEEKLFTLEFLNCQIKNFEYGPTEKSNIPPVISLIRLKNEMNLKMSASEMLCFVRYFGLIIGDIIPEGNECWQLYKYLREIIDIVTSPRIIRSDANVLKKLIEQHNELYIKLFGALKPKFHHLLHYPRILLQNGPCIHFWNMRFEFRHRQLKSNVQATSCTKNLLKTIATKQALQMCQMINDIKVEKVIFGAKTRFTNQVNHFNQVEIQGTLYKVGMFIVTVMESIDEEFGEIMKIIEMNNEVSFELKIFEEVTFDEHYHAYIVESKDVENQIMKYEELPLIAPCLSVKNQRKPHYTEKTAVLNLKY